MKKLKILILFIVFIIGLFVFCKKKEFDGSYFIAQNFLKIVDTTSFKTGSLIFLRNENEFNSINPTIFLSPEISYNKKIDEIIKDKINTKETLARKYRKLIYASNSLNFDLNQNFPKKIGKFLIVFDEKLATSKDNYSGNIYFQNFKIENDLAILVLNLSVDKHVKSYIIFMERKNHIWQLVSKELLYVS